MMEMKNLHTNNMQRNWFYQKTLNKPSEYFDYYYKWMNFALRYNKSLFEAATESYRVFLGERGRITQTKKIRGKMRQAFDSYLRTRLNRDDITISLADMINSWLNVVNLWGYTKLQPFFSDFLSTRNRIFEPLRDNLNRTPSEVIKIKGRFNLHHYRSNQKIRHKTPLLMVYSLINRYYILDLMPEVSIVQNLLNQGFDVYTTDWGIPDFYEKDITLENYSHDYIGNAVDKIKELTGSENVSLFGYCWGGIFVLIYSAIHPENVKNLILHATPIDLGGKGGLVDNWSAHLDVDKLVDTLGNVPGWFVNMAFVLRNPVEIFLKYYSYYSEPKNLQEIIQFFWIETWLYDGRPIIGETFREIINKISKKNLLIKNRLMVDDHLIDLKKITMPVLSIVGSGDDLVPPQSSKTIMNVIGSEDKKLIEFPTGHVGLCIGKKAHKQLWPEVGRWLAKRS